MYVTVCTRVDSATGGVADGGGYVHGGGGLMGANEAGERVERSL